MSANTAELAGNYAMSGGSGDPEFVAEQLAEMQSEPEPSPEQREYAATKARLEQRRDEQRRVIDVLDEPVEFRPPGVGVSRDAIELRQRALDGDEAAEADLIDLVFETLAEHAIDDEMDADFWSGFQLSTLQSVFESLVMGDISEREREQIERFRSE